MQLLAKAFEVFLHIDDYLAVIIAHYGALTYAILFLVIFCETGLVVAPFLPGDSLLFAAGAFAARGSFNPMVLFLILWVAAILGDTVNYAIGNYLGPKVFSKNYRFLNTDHLTAAEKFYEKYGAKTIIVARFMPIIRTLAPFVAGVSSMSYATFVTYNIIGGFLWVALFVFGGYFFGTIPFVAHNFEYVILAIIAISILPAVIEFIRHTVKKGHQLP